MVDRRGVVGAWSIERWGQASVRGSGITFGVPRWAAGMATLVLLGAACTPEVQPPAVVIEAPAKAALSGAPSPVATATAVPTATPSPSPTPRPPCAFVLGFAELREKLGESQVGECLESQHADAAGDAFQKTTRGQLVWRKATGLLAFDDGHATWVDGPYGVQRRPSDERFVWELGTYTARPEDGPRTFSLPPAAPGSLLPGTRIVAYYGNQLSSGMGVLGEATPPQMLARLKEQAAAFREADPSRPVKIALELVAVVAQDHPGPDGMYRLRMTDEVVDQVASWAEENDALLILDVQTGHSSVEAEVKALLPYLARPYVHLALDPEFAMVGRAVPGDAFGSMDVSDINGAIQTVAEVVSQNKLPPKMLIVHRFLETMVTRYDRMLLDPRVQVVMDMDGFGSPANKISKYELYVAEQRVSYSAIKLFYRQDRPLMSPSDVLALDPVPDVVIYQ